MGEANTIVYEVTAVVETEIADGFEQFMRDHHIADVLSTKLFMNAVLETSKPGRYRIRYFAATREDLDRYLSDQAPRLRKDVLDRFPTGVELSREVWSVIATFA